MTPVLAFEWLTFWRVCFLANLFWGVDKGVFFDRMSPCKYIFVCMIFWRKTVLVLD